MQKMMTIIMFAIGILFAISAVGIAVYVDEPILGIAIALYLGIQFVESVCKD